ncbi:MAG TPA: hypothetical protein VIY47_07300, partial [Ignavibacteriaceae bacterium]
EDLKEKWDGKNITVLALLPSSQPNAIVGKLYEMRSENEEMLISYEDSLDYYKKNQAKMPMRASTELILHWISILKKDSFFRFLF